MTREEAIREAKMQMVTCGGYDRIASKGGMWYDKTTGQPLTQKEGLELIPDSAIDESYIQQLMAQEELSPETKADIEVEKKAETEK